MKKVIFSVVAVALAASMGSAVAGDAAAGKAKSMTCVACHGANGIGIQVPGQPRPNLAGQNGAYIAKQLKAFKSGERKDPTMQAMAAPLTDADMDNLGAYYEGMK